MDALKVLLANTYGLYLKTQNYHWNVKGMQFFSLHGLFEKQYEELSAAVDEIAEHIRAQGEDAPGSFKAFSQLMTIKEAQGKRSEKEMIQDLIDSHEEITKSLKSLIDSTENDPASQDLAIERLRAHLKALWMLRSHIA